MGHLPARRAAALRAAHGLAEQEAVHVAALPRGRRPGARGSGSQEQVVRPLAPGRGQRRGEHSVGEPLSDRRRPLGAPLDLAAARRDLHAGLPGRRELAQLFRSSRGRRRQGAAPASIKPMFANDHAVDGGRRPGPMRDRQPDLGGHVAHVHERAARGGHEAHRPGRGERVGRAHVEGRHARERALGRRRRPESRIR